MVGEFIQSALWGTVSYPPLSLATSRPQFRSPYCLSTSRWDQSLLSGVILVCSQKHGWTSCLIISLLCQGFTLSSCVHYVCSYCRWVSLCTHTTDIYSCMYVWMDSHGFRISVFRWVYVSVFSSSIQYLNSVIWGNDFHAWSELIEMLIHSCVTFSYYGTLKV